MTSDGFEHFSHYTLTGPFVFDFKAILALDTPILLEPLRRRLGWTQGMPVRGTDGQLWYFPVIDLPTLAAAPGLIEDSRQAATFDHIWRREDDEERKATVKRGYDITLRRVACRLLTINYAWDDRTPRPASDVEPDLDFFLNKALGFDPTGHDVPGMSPPALLNHNERWWSLVVQGQMERMSRQIADLTETDSFRALVKGQPCLN